MTETELIEFIKPHLKKSGFLKKNKRWTKTTDAFTMVFFIQGSCYDKEDFYIRPGIYVNAVKTTDFYGHFHTELAQNTPEQVLRDFEAFCRAWTDTAYIKKTLLAFADWEIRNPLEKRRAGLWDPDKDPVPSMVCFSIPDAVKEYMIRNF